MRQLRISTHQCMVGLALCRIMVPTTFSDTFAKALAKQ